jgi:hypothetical protein
MNDPVAWRVMIPRGGMSEIKFASHLAQLEDLRAAYGERLEVQPLYAHPPAPPAPETP